MISNNNKVKQKHQISKRWTLISDCISKVNTLSHIRIHTHARARTHARTHPPTHPHTHTHTPTHTHTHNNVSLLNCMNNVLLFDVYKVYWKLISLFAKPPLVDTYTLHAQNKFEQVSTQRELETCFKQNKRKNLL